MIERYTPSVTAQKDPLTYFFIDRYPEAYVHELNDFVDAVANKRTPSVKFEDGRRALILADAANKSLRSGAKVEVTF